MNERAHPAPVHVPKWTPADAAAIGAVGRRHHGLWWACVLVVVAIGAVQVYDIVRRHDIVIETAERDFTSLVRVLAEHTARAVQAVDVVVRDTASEVSIMGLSSNRQALQQRLRDRIVAIAQVEELVIVSADGTVFTAAGQRPPITVSPGSLSYFAQHRDGRTRGLYVSEAFRQPGNGR